jgi:hypothetical protein
LEKFGILDRGNAQTPRKSIQLKELTLSGLAFKFSGLKTA